MVYNIKNLIIILFVFGVVQPPVTCQAQLEFLPWKGKESNSILDVRLRYIRDFSGREFRIESEFENGFIIAGKSIFPGNSGFGLMDTARRIILEPCYDYIYDFKNGIALVESGGLCGFIDETGREITPIKYSYNIPEIKFSEGYLAVGMEDGDKIRYGFINRNGQEIIAIKYDQAYSFSQGLACVALNGKWGYVDYSGNEVIPLTFEEAENFDEKIFHDALAKIKLNGKYGYVDKKGRESIPIKYDWMGYFSTNGFAAVENAGKFGFINREGREICPIKYDHLENEGRYYYPADAFFTYGCEPVWLNGKWGCIDTSGKEIIPVQYDSVDYEAVNYEHEKGFVVKLNGKWA